MISGGGGGGGNLQVDGTSCALRRTPVRTESIAGLYIFLRGLLRVWCASEKKTIYDSAPNPESVRSIHESTHTHEYQAP